MIGVIIELGQNVEVSRDGKTWESVESGNAETTDVLEIAWLIFHHRVTVHGCFHAKSGLYYRWK